MNLPSNVEIIDANVLVIGGGFGGAWAALRAAELTDRVVLLDKAYVSRSGASTMSGGITSCPIDGDDLDAWEEEFIIRGEYINDQDWTRQLFVRQRERVKDLDRWGVPITRDETGSIRRFSSRGMVIARVMEYNPKAAMEELRRQVLARGVKILDRVCVTDLLTGDGAWPTEDGIIGAVGFHTRDGRFLVFRAKRTVLATGTMGQKGCRKTDNDTGDGTAMAFRAGARFVEMELTTGGTFTLLMKEFFLGSYNIAVAHGARLINAKGERFMEKYDPVRFERGELPFVIAAFAKELMDGRGPVYLDLTHCPEAYWEGLKKVTGAATLFSSRIPNPRINPLPIEPTWCFGTQGRSGLRIETSCHTNMPGLLAAGAIAKNDGIGTHASAGAPTAFAMVSGWTAGDTAGRESKEAPVPTLRQADIAALHEQAFAPLRRTSKVTADELHDRLSGFEGSLVDRLVLNAERLQRLIGKAREIAAAASTAGAVHLHDLVKIHEARNLAQCMEFAYASGLDRTESRAQFYREDYPHTNDHEWFCWHGLRLTHDGIKFDKAPIPLERWKHKPSKKIYALSPIAAMMQNCFDPSTFIH